MAGHECYHCKSWIEDGAAHDCWTTTEKALTEDLSDDLCDVCYAFVRPKRKTLEVCIFLGRALGGPRVRRADKKSKDKFANLVHVRHRDEVEPPLTDWLREAYAFPDALAALAAKSRAGGKTARRFKGA